MYSRSYKGDPRWLTAKFGNCKECFAKLAGKLAFYYPNTKECFCEKCGTKHSVDFNLHKQDEDMYQSYYGQRY